MKFLFTHIFFSLTILSHCQSNDSLQWVKFKEFVIPSKSLNPIIEIKASGAKFSNNQFGLAFEFITKESVDAIKNTIAIDKIQLISNKDTLVLSKPFRDTAVYGNYDDNLLNWIFVVPLNHIDIRFLQTNVITSIIFSDALFRRVVLLDERSCKIFQKILN